MREQFILLKTKISEIYLMKFIIHSENAFSSDISFQQEYIISIIYLYNIYKIEGDRNCFLRALWNFAFGNYLKHLIIRQYLRDYRIKILRLY